MSLFRKKPVVVEATLFDGTNHDAVLEWIGSTAAYTDAVGNFFIGTLEGDMRAAEGDWIIKGVQGEFYPCKPDVFAATYEPVE
jgi:hypothetical protein